MILLIAPNYYSNIKKKSINVSNSSYKNKEESELCNSTLIWIEKVFNRLFNCN